VVVELHNHVSLLRINVWSDGAVWCRELSDLREESTDNQTVNFVYVRRYVCCHCVLWLQCCYSAVKVRWYSTRMMELHLSATGVTYDMGSHSITWLSWHLTQVNVPSLTPARQTGT